MPDQIAVVFKEIRKGRERGLFDDTLFTQDVRAINKRTAQRMKYYFGKTVATWDHTVAFHQITEIEPYPTASVYTEDLIYGFVSGGTRVRYATMTEDFAAKTTPHVLNSVPGQGDVAFVDTSRPKPGITAREFPEEVEKQTGPQHQKEVEQALTRALERKSQ